MNTMRTDHEISISELYPELNSEQKTEAVASLAQYLDVVGRIYERNRDLTALDHQAKI